MRVPCLKPQLAKGAAGSWLSLAMCESSDRGGLCLGQTLGFQGSSQAT